MGVPSFVNDVGNSQGTGTSSTTNFPSGRVNGNLLIAFVQTPSGGGKTFAVGGGWTIPAGLTNSTANSSVAIAWRYVDGTEAAPVFTWTGSANWTSRVLQFTGVQAVTPIGNTNNASAIASTTVTGASITSSQDNSLILYMLFANANRPQLPPPGQQQYATITVGGTGFSNDTEVGGTLGVSGTAGEAISYPTGAAADWNSFGIELLGTGVGANTEKVSQATAEVPLAYSTPALTAKASQLSLEVPETYSTPIMVARASQICIQVLRTQSITGVLVEPANATDVISAVIHRGPGLEQPHRKIRDPWDCDEFGRFQPGACIRPIY